MTFSTYSLMPQGLTIAFLTVAAISALTWTVAKVKQRRMERLLDDMESPKSAATEPLAAERRPSPSRQVEQQP